MSIPMNVFPQLIEAVIRGGYKKATKFISPQETAKATIIRRASRDNGGINEIRVTFGKPNYDERRFIKKLKNAGEPFPVKKIQFKN